MLVLCNHGPCLMSMKSDLEVACMTRKRIKLRRGKKNIFGFSTQRFHYKLQQFDFYITFGHQMHLIFLSLDYPNSQTTPLICARRIVSTFQLGPRAKLPLLEERHNTRKGTNPSIFVVGVPFSRRSS